MFRPALEVLEKREVFAAALVGAPMVITAAGPNPAGAHIEEVSSALASIARPFVDGARPQAASGDAGTYSFAVGPNIRDAVVYLGGSERVLISGTFGRGVADVNGDGPVDAAALRAQNNGAGPAAMNGTHELPRIIADDVFHSLLPYIEQDNLYKFAEHHAPDSIAAHIAASDEYFSFLGK